MGFENKIDLFSFSNMNTPASSNFYQDKIYKKSSSSQISFHYEDQDSGFFTPGSNCISFESPHEERTSSPNETTMSSFNQISSSFFYHKNNKIDFIYELGSKKDYFPVLSKIFNYLNDEELNRASQVSKCWNNVIQSNVLIKNRIQIYRNRKKNNMENEYEFDGKLNSFTQTSSISQQSQSKSSRLFNDISNVYKSQLNSQKEVNETPDQIKFNLFRQEGEKLVQGENLCRCPRCELPAKLSKQNSIGKCVNKGCEYIFCSKCLCPYLDSSHCCIVMPPTTPRTRRRYYSVNTKTNKTNLRRLLRY